MIESDFRELEKLFLAFGDKTRLRLLALMADGEVAVGFLAERLGESQPKVSRHLAYLRNAGVVYTRRDGKWIYYGISYPHNASQKMILETVVRTIAVMRGDGENVYFSGADEYTERILGPDGSSYADSVIETGDNSEEVIYEEEDVAYEPDSGPEEMDVFLL